MSLPDLFPSPMRAVLAIDTSTDACTVGLATEQGVVEAHRVLPRAHNRHLLAMLDEVLAGAPLSSIEGFVCGLGPGSFTGLRIAASVVQGLAWSLERPVLGMCSLEAQARAWLAENPSYEGYILATTDAQIGQCYYRLWLHNKGQLQSLSDPLMAVPEQLCLPGLDPCYGLVILGSGCRYQSAIEDSWCRINPQSAVRERYPEQRPRGAVMAQWALAHADWQHAGSAHDVIPCYVQQDVGWKTLAEQPTP